MNKEFETVDNAWRVSVPQLRFSSAARALATIGLVAGFVLLFFVMIPLGFSVKTGSGQAAELFGLLMLLLLLAGQHFVFRMILPEQYRIGGAGHFTETAKLLLVYWVAYAVILALVLLKLGGGE